MKFWEVIGYLIGLGIIVPCVQMVLDGFTGAGDPIATVASQWELAFWKSFPLIIALVLIILIVRAFSNRRT